MNLSLRLVLILSIILSVLIKPAPVSAEFLEVSSPAEIYQDSAFEIDINVSAQPNSSYHIKARLGQSSSTLNKGQTFDPANGVWLSDTVSWEKFPTFQTTSEGSWTGKLKVKPTATASLGSNFLLVRIHRVENKSNYDSPTYSVTLLKPIIVPPTVPQPTIKPESKPVLNEFMAQPLDKTEWVELRNDSDVPADISGWKIDDEEGKSSPQIIADNTIIQPKGYFVLNFSSFKLNDLSDSVRLLKNDDSVVESFTYTKTVKGESWAKDSNSNWFITSEPTPNAENKFTYISETPNPTTSPNQKPDTNLDENILAVNKQQLAPTTTLPTLNKSSKIATVSSSFTDKQSKIDFSKIALFLSGSLLIAAAIGILLRHSFAKLFKKGKAVLPS